ncbi:MAG: GNAT family N-acetyltransferase [Caulobacteraceae bacterium]|nr:GNAT family N-acetyltransferase [Caulobacteraceae bacterium]
MSEFKPSDLPDVCQLQELLWQGGAERNAAYMRWKYAENPYLDHRYVVLARQAGALVGMIGAFGALWEVPGVGDIMLPCLADTVIADSHRGTPLFRHMLQHLVQRLGDDDVPWLLDFGDQPAGPAMLMRGWTSVGPWAIGAFRRDRPGPGSWSCEARGKRSGLQLRCVDSPSPKALAQVIARVTSGGPRARHVRDATYLSWRLKNPLARYYLLTAQGDGLEGYLLGHRTLVDGIEGETPTTIMDCEAASDSVWLDLAEAALTNLPGREIMIWARDMSATRRAVLADLGMMFRAPKGRLTADMNLPNLIMCRTRAQAHDPVIEDLSKPDHWDLGCICGRSWR